MANAVFTPVDRPDLYKVEDSDFYQIKPVPGAKISGTFRVHMSSHDAELPGSSPLGFHRNEKVTAPRLRVDLNPCYVNDRGASGDRAPLTINGKTYDEMVYAEVDYQPAKAGDYRRASVAGREYVLTVVVHSTFGNLTDSAGNLCDSVLQAIAAEYVTDERFHAHLVRMAEASVKSAEAKRVAAQAEVDKAQAALEAVKAHAPAATQAA